MARKKSGRALRLLVADDHQLVRAGFCALLGRIPFFEVVAEAGDGREVLDQIAQHKPDIVVMDLTMPNLNGIETLVRIKKQSPKTKVIIVSMHFDEEHILPALHAGASGYIVKDAAFEELELAIKSVARGETYLGPSIPRNVLNTYLKGTGDRKADLEQLTARQREILQLIAEGKSTKEIAYDLKISNKTVETHRAGLMERLEIYDVAGLVHYAIRGGLVSSTK